MAVTLKTKDSEDYISYIPISGKQTKHRESCFRKQTYKKITLFCTLLFYYNNRMLQI